MRILTGIKPTGELHLGNYVGAMRPVLDLLQSETGAAENSENAKSSVPPGFLFIADGHALTSVSDGAAMRQMTRSVAAAWMAMGLDPEKVLFYRQSAVPQVFELFWILSCVCPKGLMNRAHAYKAVVQPRQEASEEDIDRDVMMGLFNYPVLMAADILLFQAHKVPVGPDQLQHVEIARDLALKFNQAFGEVFPLPEASIPKAVPTLTGLDGRKMSKSYNNVIPLFADSKKLKSLIAKIKTNSQTPDEPKETEGCALFQLYQVFASADQVKAMRARYAGGIGWADVKAQVFQVVDEALAAKRARYDALMADPKQIDNMLQAGEQRAFLLAERLMEKVRRRVGFEPRPLSVWPPKA